jgi:LysM repeat protein
MVPGGGDSFQDYLYDEYPIVDDTNYGWPEVLEFDEYPLEIQCSPCFIDKFKYGLSSKWGDVFDEITVQVRSNMEQNCGQSITFSPAHDLRGKGVGVEREQVKVQTPDCPQYRTMESESDENCFAVALSLSVPTTAISYLNDVNCADLSGETMCAPAPCEVARVIDAAKTTTWIEQYENFTEPQFFRWNPWVGLQLEKDELVCVGPPNGFFTPVQATPAQPTEYTTTATPTMPTQTGTVSNCGRYHSVVLGEDCNTIALNYSITFSDLRAMNPSIDTTCSNLLWGFDYCIAVVDGSSLPPETTPTPVPAPGPTTPGVTQTCYKWYGVVSGDDCDKITRANGVSFAQFREWNPYIDETCSNLWADTYYCISGSTSSGGGTPTTSSSTGVATVAPPGPTNDGASSACARWHIVQSGDACDAIASRYGITFARLRELNPHIDSGCTNIWPDYAYCVAVR